MKILIIGFGSIGKRHYQNLLSLGYKDIQIYDIDKSLTTIKKINLKVLKEFDLVLVCNPNHFHVKTALQAAEAGCDLFIEKPLSHNLKDIDKLIKICKRKKLVNMVACNMRFHSCLKFIKTYLDKNKLGRVYSISHEFGYYLPYWRPNQDYRKNYAAKKRTGGGIILDDIHEFDLLFWLNDFNQIDDSKFVYDKVSDLKIKTEDICLASFKFKNKVLGLVKSDYLNKNYTRNCQIIGQRGTLEWDFNKNIVWLKKQKTNKKLLELKNYQFNQYYLDQISYFIECVKKRKPTFNDIQRAGFVLKHCLKKS